MSHPYDAAVKAIQSAYATQLKPIGFDDWVTAKGGIRALIIAQHLGHTLVPGDKGADGIDAQKRTYEYKVSGTNQFAFHFGSRKSADADNDAMIEKHFKGHHGAVCARIVDCKIVEYVFVPVRSIVADLKKHFRTCKGKQLNKVYSIERLKALDGAAVNSVP